MMCCFLLFASFQTWPIFCVHRFFVFIDFDFSLLFLALNKVALIVAVFLRTFTIRTPARDVFVNDEKRYRTVPCSHRLYKSTKKRTAVVKGSSAMESAVGSSEANPICLSDDSSSDEEKPAESTTPRGKNEASSPSEQKIDKNRLLGQLHAERLARQAG